MIIKARCVNNLCGAVVVVGFIGIMFGSATSWSSPIISKLEGNCSENPLGYALNHDEIAWIISLLTVGGCIGCFMFAILADLLGRRFSLIILSLPIGFSYLAMILYQHILVFYIARFVMGISLGGIVLVNMYTSEIANSNIRGAIMSWPWVTNRIGALLSYCVGPWVSIRNFNIILLIFPVIIIFFSIIFCEETPYYYVLEENIDLAEKSLRAYRADDADIDKEINEIREDIRQHTNKDLFPTLKSKAFKKSFVIGNLLIIFQQLTGINCMVMYSHTMFRLVENRLSPTTSSIILGILLLVTRCLAIFVIELFNRKTLLTVSCMGMIISQTILGLHCILDDHKYDFIRPKFLPVCCFGIFAISYNFGVGPLSWIVGTELYPTRTKALAVSVSICIYFTIAFLTTAYFYNLTNTIGIGYMFLIFSSNCVVFIVFICLFVIETRGKSIEEIQLILEG